MEKPEIPVIAIKNLEKSFLISTPKHDHVPYKSSFFLSFLFLVFEMTFSIKLKPHYKVEKTKKLT